MNHQDNKDLKVLSLFTGCGGMDLGFEGRFKVLSKSINTLIYPTWKNNATNGRWMTLPPTRFTTIFANDIFPAAKAAWLPYFEKKFHHSDKQFYLASIVDLGRDWPHYTDRTS